MDEDEELKIYSENAKKIEGVGSGGGRSGRVGGGQGGCERTIEVL